MRKQLFTQGSSSSIAGDLHSTYSTGSSTGSGSSDGLFEALHHPTNTTTTTTDTNNQNNTSSFSGNSNSATKNNNTNSSTTSTICTNIKCIEEKQHLKQLLCTHECALKEEKLKHERLYRVKDEECAKFAQTLVCNSTLLLLLLLLL